MVKKATTKTPTKKTTKSTTKTSTPKIPKTSSQETSSSSTNNWFGYTSSTNTANPVNYAPSSKEKGYVSNLKVDYAAPKPEFVPKSEPLVKNVEMKVIKGGLSDNKPKEKYFSNAESDKIIDYAIKIGISDFIKKNPEMEGVQNLLTKYIDRGSVRGRFARLYKEGIENNMSSEEARDHAYSIIRDYIGGGESLNNRGKMVLIKGELEKKLEEKEKGMMFRIFHHNQVKGRKYMNKAMDAFDDLNTLLKTGDYDKRMPEIAKAVNTLYDLKFLEPAIEVLKQYDLITDRKYNYLKRNLYKKAKDESNALTGGIESYVLPKAAALIGLGGVILTLFNLTMTGAVIGGDSNVTLGSVGVFMIFFALLLFIRPLKKSFKK
ncbi:MAG: hypothetical protein ACP5NZ_02335 [Nanobdellota archaeon]